MWIFCWVSCFFCFSVFSPSVSFSGSCLMDVLFKQWCNWLIRMMTFPVLSLRLSVRIRLGEHVNVQTFPVIKALSMAFNSTCSERCGASGCCRSWWSVYGKVGEVRGHDVFRLRIEDVLYEHWCVCGLLGLLSLGFRVELHFVIVYQIVCLSLSLPSPHLSILFIHCHPFLQWSVWRKASAKMNECWIDESFRKVFSMCKYAVHLDDLLICFEGAIWLVHIRKILVACCVVGL